MQSVLVFLAAMLANDAREIVVKPTIEPGEAVEFRVANNQPADQITFLILYPSETTLKTFVHGNVLIVDPPPELRGTIRIVARVVNFETRETLDLEATTQVAERAESAGSLRQLSTDSAPGYSGLVLGAWRKAAGALSRGDEMENVTNQLIADLNAAGAPEWKKHFDAVFAYMDGRPLTEAPAMFTEIANGIEAKK